MSTNAPPPPPNDKDAIAAIPLDKVCDVVGVPEEAVIDLYDELLAANVGACADAADGWDGSRTALPAACGGGDVESNAPRNCFLMVVSQGTDDMTESSGHSGKVVGDGHDDARAQDDADAAGERQRLVRGHDSAVSLLSNCGRASFVLLGASHGASGGGDRSEGDGGGRDHRGEVTACNNYGKDDHDHGRNTNESGHSSFQVLASRANSFMSDFMTDAALPPRDVVEVKLEIEKRTHTAHARDDGYGGVGSSDDKLRKYKGDVDVRIVVKRSVPFVGYLLLFTATVAMSTSGTAVQLQDGVSGPLKSFWRTFATVLALMPLAARSAARDGRFMKNRLSKSDWFLFVWSGMGYMMADMFFVVSLGRTSVTDAYIFANTHCLILVVFKVVAGKAIKCAEGLGVILGFLGGVVCALDGSGGGKDNDDDGNTPNGDNVNGGGDGQFISTGRALAAAAAAAAVAVAPGPSLVGDLIALLSGLGTAIYLTLAKTLRPKVDIFVYMLLQYSAACVWMLAYMVASGEEFTLSAHPRIGLFGWVQPRADRLLVELWLVLIVNIMGIVACVASMKYFEPLVVSCCINMTPVVASFFAVALRVEELPGIATVLGDIVVFVGTYMVIKSEADTTEVKDVSITKESCCAEKNTRSRK